jgi:hypothetical protein
MGDKGTAPYEDYRWWGLPTKLAPGEIKLEYWPILIGCIKGTPGSNEFGADPLRVSSSRHAFARIADWPRLCE